MCSPLSSRGFVPGFHHECTCTPIIRLEIFWFSTAETTNNDDDDDEDDEDDDEDDDEEEEDDEVQYEDLGGDPRHDRGGGASRGEGARPFGCDSRCH